MSYEEEDYRLVKIVKIGDAGVVEIGVAGVVDNAIYVFPLFVHGADWGAHNYRGSLIRHKAIEKTMLKFRAWLINHDAMPLYDLLNAFLGIIFGFNCSFPSKDIALYTVWYLRGCKALAIISGRKRSE